MLIVLLWYFPANNDGEDEEDTDSHNLSVTVVDNEGNGVEGVDING